MQYGTPWTADEEALLRKLLPEGLTISQLGDRLGRTRNSIQRKLASLGLRTMGKHPGMRYRGKFAKAEDRASHDVIPRAGRITLPPLASLQEPC